MARSRLIRAFNGGGPFLQVTGAGAGLRDLSVLAAPGTSLGNAVKVLASDVVTTADGHNFLLQNVKIGGIQQSGLPTGTWAWSILLDGAQNTSSPAPRRGLRGVSLTNVEVSHGVGGTLWARSVVNLTIQGGRFQRGQIGAPGLGNVFVRGSVNLPSEGLTINARVEGLLSLTHTKTSNFDVVVDDFIAWGSVSFVFVKGISLTAQPTNWLAKDSRRDLAPWRRK